MRKTQAKLTVTTSQWRGILIEKYNYTRGAVEPLPKHSHYDYQLGLSFDCSGEYFYRGAYHVIPSGSLSIIHSGEVHAPSERTYLPEPATFWMMHVNPRVLEEAALEIAQKTISLPFFAESVLRDRSLVKLFQRLCIAGKTNINNLEKDSLALEFFSRLITRYSSLSSNDKTDKPAITIVCDYLQAHYQTNISLTELAEISGLSRYYLSRLFHREMGLSLRAYQMQIRIDRAKKLLADRIPIAQVASETGFYDQSHFGYYFRRLVGTTPGNYQQAQ